MSKVERASPVGDVRAAGERPDLAPNSIDRTMKTMIAASASTEGRP